MKQARILLLVLGLAFVIQGAVQSVAPGIILDLVSISAGSVTGQIELRVIYGGLHIALGALCLWGAVNAENTRPALTAMLFVALGTALPRVILAFTYRDFGAYSVMAMASESAIAILIFWMLRNQELRVALD